MSPLARNRRVSRTSCSSASQFFDSACLGVSVRSGSAMASERIVWFHVIGEIRDIEVIAAGPSIRHVRRLRRLYGPGRWRKLKGTAIVALLDGSTFLAEVHWCEAHGIGRREMKIKYLHGSTP